MYVWYVQLNSTYLLTFGDQSKIDLFLLEPDHFSSINIHGHGHTNPASTQISKDRRETVVSLHVIFCAQKAVYEVYRKEM